MQAILDPLSVTAQRLAPVLRMLQDYAAVDVHLMLVPESNVTSLPLRSYYSFARPSGAATKEHSGLSLHGDPVASFFKLPEDRLLTMHVHMPEPWLIEVRLPSNSLQAPWQKHCIQLNNRVKPCFSPFQRAQNFTPPATATRLDVVAVHFQFAVQDNVITRLVLVLLCKALALLYGAHHAL